MKKYTGARRCLICRRATLENSSLDPEKHVSNAALLQHFLHCFHINVLDSEVNDLATSCQFCPTCEQFIVEWRSILTQMTELPRRAAQLEATVSALLLSAHEIQEQNHNEEVAEIINSRIQNSQEVELPLLLQQTVDDIRNELQKKYSVNVMVDQIPLPCPASNFNQEEFVPLSGHYNNDSEPLDECSGDDESDTEYLPSEDQNDNEETSEQISEVRIKTEEEASSDGSHRHDSVELKEMNVNRKSKARSKVARKSQTDGVPRIKKRHGAIIPDGPNRFKYKEMSFQLNEEDQTYTCDACGFKSLPKIMSIWRHLRHHLTKPSIEPGKRKRRKHQTVIIPDGPNTFKYHGHPFKLNDEDQCYYCGACDFKGQTKINSVLIHIRELHYTEEDKLKFTAVQINDTEWLYGGEYKIIAVGEKFKCVSCGCIKSDYYKVIGHIREQHVDMKDPKEAVPLPATDTPSVNDSTPIEGVFQSVPYTFNPINSKYTCGICQFQVFLRKNFARHIKDRHTAPAQKVICEICGKELLNQRSYLSHLKIHQTEPKNCPNCNKKFHCERSFNRHMKVHKFGEAAKKYQCEYCGKRFALCAQHRSHLLVHTGEMPFECDVCGEKFRRTAGLSQHRKSAHGIQPQRRDHHLMRIND